MHARSLLDLVAHLLASIGTTHTPRALARAIATSLGTAMPLVALELEVAGGRVLVELVDADWRHLDTPTRALTSVVPGLAVATRGPLPDYFAEPGFRAVLAEVIASAARHLGVVQRVAERSRRAHVENRELRADLDRLERQPAIVARSAAMRGVLARVALVARHPTTVSITGESGTGKEVIARELHRLSPRARRPMLHLNCGAIPEALVESELFGHERGAFTGADRAHAGVFERAHRSTLFLDEIGELPLAAQAKLLRVLQERQVRRVGGTTDLDLDVRLVTATNRSLPAMVRDGSFREDLFYRLEVFAIAIPPLRDRKADLGPLVATLVEELAAKLAIPPPPITRRVLARLEAHAWPGNVRELANVLEAALILGGGRALELPDHLAAVPAVPEGRPFDSAIRTAIAEALRATRGKIYGTDGAAARLGLPPGTLQSKMRRLGMQRGDYVRGP